MLQVKPQTIQMKADVVKLFCHESSRIFHDRLIDNTDRGYFNKILADVAEKNFAAQQVLDNLHKNPPIFGDFSKRGVPAEERIYTELPDPKALAVLLEEYLEEYNLSLNKDIRLIFFLDAIQAAN